MNEQTIILKLEEIIGYQFENSTYLLQSMMHSSYTNEKKMNKLKCNERLEFLGDAVLELVSSEFLYSRYPEVPEGELTKKRASMVCEPTLAICGREMNIGTYLMLGKGEDMTGGRNRDSIVSDAVEALIGAIYLDGGFANAKEFILKHVLNNIEHKQLFYDSKTILQEIVQRKDGDVLSYVLTGQDGPDHNKKFYVDVQVNNKTIGRGQGHTKKAAEQAAAYEAVCLLNQQ